MLRIGTSHYQIVEANSALSVQLFPPGESVLGRRQVWELQAHFVPQDVDYTPRPDGEPEYLELSLRAENYQVQDWRKLSNFGMDSESDDDPMIMASLCNRLVLTSGNRPEDMPITIRQAERISDHPDDEACDFLFDVSMQGVRRLDDGSELELEVNTILTFKEIIAYVPLNAADPVKAAGVMAVKIIKLHKFAGSRVTPYDPARITSLTSHINSHHVVRLQTPWA
jgi:hypothetical protein